MPTIDERVAKLEEKLRQAKAQKAQIEARQKAASAKRERADDTRRKVLLGALVMEEAQRGDAAAGAIFKKLDGFLTRPNDRALFKLREKPAKAAAEPKPEKPEKGGDL